nr:hypothetical protein [Tanacetum cinerariifolium]
TNVHDDVGVPDTVADDNSKATSVCDDIDQADAAVDDNAKVPIFDVYNTPVDNKYVLMKDAHVIINHTDPPIHGFQIMLWDSLEKKGDGLDEAKANQEVVSVADNGEVVKETQLPDSHEDDFQPRASKKNEEGDSVIRLSACYWKSFEGNPPCALGRFLIRESNTPKTRIHILKEVLDYLNQAKKPRHWFP